MTELVHRSSIVPGEHHLGPLNECRLCRPFIRRQQAMAYREEIINRFTYHAPHGNQATRYEMIRSRALELALFIVDTTPPSLDQSLALTKLDESVMHANAAIARHEPAPAAGDDGDQVAPDDPTQPAS